MTETVPGIDDEVGLAVNQLMPFALPLIVTLKPPIATLEVTLRFCAEGKVPPRA